MLSFGLPSHTTARRPPTLRRRVAPAAQALRAPQALNRACACGGSCPHCSGETGAANLQPKLSISEPGDALERDADRVADQVMQMPASAEPDMVAATSSSVPSLHRASALQRKCACGGGSGGCSDCKAESEGKLQRRAGDREPATAPPIVHEVLRSPGRPLDASTRGFMEPRFGADFGDVRVHADSQGAESAQAVHSRAYTVGRNIAFGAGEYRPDSEGGRRLLAHELAHVVQQAGAAQPGVQRANDAEQAESAPAIGEEPAQPMGPPNAAPSCADVCGEKDKCIREPSEACSTDEDKIITAAWNKVATNLTNAVNNFTPGSLSATATKSLKDNFNWSPGSSPADLPDKVKANLDDAMTKFSDNLCTKCVECPAGEARIDKRRDQLCLKFNCFMICHGLKDDKAGAHALTHELFHRVVPHGPAGEVYRGQAGYPLPPTMSLKQADPYASLIDDLLPATPATPTPAKPGAPPSAPAPTPAPPPDQ
jgi:hypothetical protein